MKDTKVFPNCFLAVLCHHIRAFRCSGSSIDVWNARYRGITVPKCGRCDNHKKGSRSTHQKKPTGHRKVTAFVPCKPIIELRLWLSCREGDCCQNQWLIMGKRLKARHVGKFDKTRTVRNELFLTQLLHHAVEVRDAKPKDVGHYFL